MMVFSFRTLGYVWAGLAASAVLSAGALEASYVPPVVAIAELPAPVPVAPPPAPVVPVVPKRVAALPVPPVPPRMRVAHAGRRAVTPVREDRWDAGPYQYPVLRSFYYVQSGYYGWQPRY